MMTSGDAQAGLNKIKANYMKHTIQQGVITKLAIIVAVVITSITQYTYAELRQQLPQGQKDTGKISVQDSQNVAIGEFNAKGDLILGGTKITNIYKFPEYEQLLDEIGNLEQDLKDIPLDKTVSRLNKSKKLEEKRKQLQDFKQEVLRLAGTFSKIEINTERLKKAQQYFTQGKFREADAILKAEELSHDQEHLLNAKEGKSRELEELNKQLLGNANEFLIKAQITATNFNNPNRFHDAYRFYEQSIRSYTYFDNLFEYAFFLQRHNQHNEAERYYQEVMDKFGREMDTVTRAATLNNLGLLQSDKNEFEDALRSYREALEICGKLAQANPQTYLPYVATTLNNLGSLQYKKNELEDALKSYREALEIRRKLAQANPQTYLPYIAMTLNNLGVLQEIKNEFKDALKSYKEALEIYRKLAQANPQTYLPYVATTLNNLGPLQYNKN
jgi:tetratricopeptide (TPR) repeat protein